MTAQPKPVFVWLIALFSLCLATATLAQYKESQIIGVWHAKSMEQDDTGSLLQKITLTISSDHSVSLKNDCYFTGKWAEKHRPHEEETYFGAWELQGGNFIITYYGTSIPLGQDFDCYSVGETGVQKLKIIKVTANTLYLGFFEDDFGIAMEFHK